MTVYDKLIRDILGDEPDNRDTHSNDNGYTLYIRSIHSALFYKINFFCRKNHVLFQEYLHIVIKNYYY